MLTAIRFMLDKRRISSGVLYTVILFVVTAGIYASSFHSYLLFHSLVEIVTVAIAFALFLLLWNAREYLENNYLRMIGVGYAVIAFIDLLHTLAYKGMNVFPGHGANLATQFWIAARYLQTATLLSAPMFIHRKLNDAVLLGGYIAAAAGLVTAVFSGRFPDCFIDGKGLTGFKIISEYVMTAALSASLILLHYRRNEFQKNVFRLIFTSVLFTVASELSFTAYVSVYGFSNMVGHFCKLAAFYLIYRAILVTGIREPFDIIFRERVQAERKLEEAVAALTVSNEELDQTNHYLKDAQSRILQQEKMASIGQLAAGVAHEINNPMGFISSNLSTLNKYLKRIFEYTGILTDMLKEPSHIALDERISSARSRLRIDDIADDAQKLVVESLYGAERVNRLVQKLMSFSRVDQSEATSVDINECIETTLTMVRNEFEHTATIEKKYGKLPQTWCYPQLINQVFMNLLLNAGQAVEKQGAIIIRTWFEDGSILVAISDTGAGIPKENLSRIFEPFFTTREVGQGSGLGLSVAYDIIKKHNGDISVESEAGKGTTFTVRIPVHEKSDPPVKRERL